MGDIRFNFNNENYAVVGASSGIGKQITFDLAKAGASVLAIGRNFDNLIEVKNRFPDNISIISLDILKADEEKLATVLDDYVGKHGKINGGVYTAGITCITSLATFDMSAAESVMNTSFWGLIKFLRLASKGKFANPAASFVALSSIAAKNAPEGLFIYSASKSAVETAVKSISKELSRKKMRINTISPSWIKTPMTLNSLQHKNAQIYHRFRLGEGTTQNVSQAALFLLSDAASWITGTDIVIDGGGEVML